MNPVRPNNLSIGRPRRRGLTLLELLLAIIVTSFVGLALATALTATARGMTSAGDARSALQRAHAAYVRLRAYTDSGLCLLQHDAELGFVIWIDDSRTSHTVNLSEMRVFWVKPGTKEITVERVSFPPEWPAELLDSVDTQVENGSDYFTVMLDQRALGNTKEEVLADGVKGVELIYGEPDLMDAKRFRVRMTMDAGADEVQPVLMALGMRSHMKPR